MIYDSINSFINKINKIDLSEEKALDNIARTALKNIKARHGVYPTDTYWKPLSEYSLKTKKTGDSPLLETGELRNSYTIIKKKGERVVGSDNFKAVRMEYGVAMENIPARPVVEPEAIQAEKYTDKEFDTVLEEYINQI